jgi:hypothetical protein
MPLSTSRRGFIGGLLALVAAPAIVRADIIMPVKVWRDLPPGHPWYDSQSWQELRRFMLGREIESIAQQPAIYAQHFDAVMRGLLPGGLPVGTYRFDVSAGEWNGFDRTPRRRGKWVGVVENDLGSYPGHSPITAIPRRSTLV